MCLLKVGAVDVLVSPESGPTAAFLEVLPFLSLLIFLSLLFFSFLFTFQTGLPGLHRVSGLHLWLPARWRKSGRGYRKLVITVFVLFL